MFDIGWSELLVIAVVLIVVVGPKDLPPMIRAFGKTMAGLRKMAGEFRSQFDEALKEADMDDVRQTISDVRNLNPTNSLRDAMNPLRQLGNEIKSDLQKATTPPDSLSSTPATSTAAPATSEPVAPLVSVPEPEMKLPDTPPVTAAPVAAPVVPVEKTKRARAKSIATVEAEAVAAKPKRASRAKAVAASAPVAVNSTESSAAKPTVKAVAKKAAARKVVAEKPVVVADAKPAKPAKTKAAKPKKDEA
ncbi:Sec-independent protein translocase protein TatB [Agrobacterium sp. DE0009]|uniref:Sec-independent protein translocase protein TatB n=1 Tax=Agrobacterium sp. DE0009 TaxID=2587505 RepID=UPI0011A22AE5|nr:Sec-independent protein translocase protein TatB [Agrobacterium sp. DE0009]